MTITVGWNQKWPWTGNSYNPVKLHLWTRTRTQGTSTRPLLVKNHSLQTDYKAYLQVAWLHIKSAQRHKGLEQGHEIHPRQRDCKFQTSVKSCAYLDSVRLHIMNTQTRGKRRETWGIEQKELHDKIWDLSQKQIHTSAHSVQWLFVVNKHGLHQQSDLIFTATQGVVLTGSRVVHEYNIRGIQTQTPFHS